ncbi:PTS fructose transporter subunit IIABC [Spiroplasma taiwanense]|uniref:PTS system fructose-specific IIABC component n=1 Tax=Spiroplasma taiwanense CT-1 TaxID=1276220 RepID=S5MBC4_9MOLU|nr:fructose-specific PTS transporter subunit EIIC [Spiroplasma taiwanense]AGR41073.1 PTS system fructose-specific IIABC component [Spiroplasma taiwanense CT-1]
MELKDLFSKQISFFEEDLNSKDEVIEFLSKKLQEQKFVKSAEDFKAAVYKRESEGSTGVGDGIGIPHVLNKTVLKSAIAFVKLKNKIDWQSLDDQPVDLVFMIMTNGVDSDEHLTALAELSGFLMKSEIQTKLRNAKSIKDIETAFTKKEVKEVKTSKNGHFDVIGITACPTGIAHTYMAAEKLEEYAKSLNMSVKIETQGRRGTENKLTDEDIKNAKVIILAHDKALQGMSRFNGVEVIDTHTKEAIFKGKELISGFSRNPDKKVINVADDGSSSNDEFSLRKFLDFKGNLLAGVSRMLPFVVAGGIILGIAFLIDFIAGTPGGKDFGTVNEAAGWFAAIGKTAMSIMVPVLAGYIAYTIVGPQGLMPGFVAGLLADGSGFAYGGVGSWSGLWIKLFPNQDIPMVSGFIGGMVGAYVAALIIFGLMKLFSKFTKSFHGVRDIVLVPVLSLLLTALAMFVLNIPLGYTMWGIKEGLLFLTKTKELLPLLGMIIALMMCVDMGGPINKIAYTLGTLSVGGGLGDDPKLTIIMAASMAGGMIPPLGIALCNVLFSKVWTSKERDAAKANWLMGAFFITEGAIPFMITDAKRISISALISGAITGVLVGLFGITLGAPHGGVAVFPLLEFTAFDVASGTALAKGLGVSLYILSIIIGTVIMALILGFWKTADVKKGKLVLASSNGVKENIEFKIKKINENKNISNAKKKKNYQF